MCAALLHPSGRRQSRDAGIMRRERHVERAAHTMQQIDNRRRRVAPAQPQPAQPEHLRERARHHRVVGGIHQRGARVVIRPVHVFGVGGIQHQQHVVRQPGPQARRFGAGDERAGGIVRVGQEHHARRRRHRGQNGVHIGEQVAFRHLHHVAPGQAPGDVVDRKTVRRHDQLGARSTVDVAQQEDQVVGAGAAHDPRRIEAEPVGDRLPQLGRTAIGIPVRIRRHPRQGLRHARWRPERALIGGELDHPRKRPAAGSRQGW